MALAECCIRGSIGFKGTWEIQGRLDTTVFGEFQSGIVISIEPRKVKQLEKIATQEKVPMWRLGVVGGRRLVIAGLVDLPLEQIERVWRRGLEEALGQ